MEPRRRPKIFRLKRNHGTETPGSLVFVDTESHQKVIRSKPLRAILTFRLFSATYVRYEQGVVSRRDTIDGLDWKEFWEWFETKQTKERPLWCFGHNLGFDLTQLHFWELSQLGRFKCGLTTPAESNGVLSGSRSYRGRLCVDGFPFYVYCLGQRGVCKFVDTLNYYPKSLEKIGESIGFEKLDFPGFEADDETMFRYCRRDVDITEKLMLETLDCWRESDGGVFQPTAAMLSLTSFRHKLPRLKREADDPTITYDSKDQWQPLEREAYYGGQVTCFYVGAIRACDIESRDLKKTREMGVRQRPEGPLYLLDVRALYPSVMRSGRFPARRLFRQQAMRVSELRGTMRSKGAVARVLINSPIDEYTIRTEEGQKQACGRFETVLCGPELERALEYDHVEKVVVAQIYVLDRLFGQWVDDWMEARDKADRLGNRVRGDYCKLILTSLSGKLAQRGEHWVERHKDKPPYPYGPFVRVNADTGERRVFRAVAGVTQERIPGDDPWYTFPSISAYVTAMGRERMREYRKLCPPDSVLYQATDSLLLTEEGYFALESRGMVKKGQMGLFELRHQGDDGDVFGCNHYRIGDHWVMSGRKEKATRNPDGTWTFMAFEQTPSVLQTQPDGSIQIDELTICRDGPYRKGKIGPEGWVSWPTLGTDDLSNPMLDPLNPQSPLTEKFFDDPRPGPSKKV